MWYAADIITTLCVTYVQKNFKIQTLIKQLLHLDKISNFHEIISNFTYSQKA